MMIMTAAAGELLALDICSGQYVDQMSAVTLKILSILPRSAETRCG